MTFDTGSMQQSAPDVAYAWIRNYILSIPREKDAFLNEVALAKETETSRTPVREALLRLESERFLRRIPRKGAYVPQITDADIRALMDARSLVECWAANTARASIVEHAEEFQALIDTQRAEQQHTARFIELDIEFHSKIIALAGNPVITEFYDTLRQRQLRIGIRAVTVENGRAERVLTEHQAILDAILAEEGVDASIHEHLRSTLNAATAA